jgi:hypothetical protein
MSQLGTVPTFWDEIQPTALEFKNNERHENGVNTPVPPEVPEPVMNEESFDTADPFNHGMF